MSTPSVADLFKTSWHANGKKNCEAYRDSFDEVLQVKGWDAKGNEREYPNPSILRETGSFGCAGCKESSRASRMLD